jgi:hypothetical protein
MNTKQDRTSPFGLKIWMTKPEMDKICLDELRKSKKYLPEDPGPINIERFLESYLGVTVDYQDLGEGFLGCAMFAESGKPIRVIVSGHLESDEKPTQRRLRSTLAHEAGHCIFHPALFMSGNPQSDLFDQDVNMKQGKILCRDNSVGTGKQFDGRWWEYQANRAIGGFLLPRPLLDKALEDLLDYSPITETKSLSSSTFDSAVDLVAETFDVNPVVASYRLSELYKSDGNQITF